MPENVNDSVKTIAELETQIAAWPQKLIKERVLSPTLQADIKLKTNANPNTPLVSIADYDTICEMAGCILPKGRKGWQGLLSTCLCQNQPGKRFAQCHRRFELTGKPLCKALVKPPTVSHPITTESLACLNSSSATNVLSVKEGKPMAPFNLIGRLTEEVEDWSQFTPKYRLLSPQLIEKLGKKINQNGFLDEAYALFGCVLDKNKAGWQNMLIDCLRQEDGCNRIRRCNPRFTNNDQPYCLALQEENFPDRKGRFSPADVEIITQPEREEFIFDPKQLAIDTNNWLNRTLVSYDGNYKQVPAQLRGVLMNLASQGTALFANGQICPGERICSGDCPTCVDGVLRNLLIPRFDLFNGGLIPNDYRSADFITPQVIADNYNLLADNPTDRLSAFGGLIEQY